jgi:hypothetical protein
MHARAARVCITCHLDRYLNSSDRPAHCVSLLVLLLVVLLLVVVTLLVLLLLAAAACWPPMIDVMAAASATVKFGSAVMAAAAALTVSDIWPIGGLGCANCAAAAASTDSADDICRPENLDWLYSMWGGIAKAGAIPPPGKGIWNCPGAGGRAALSGRALGGPCGPWVRSSVTVGNGAEAEMVAMLEEHGSTVRARKLELISPDPSALGMEPESSMDAAADVVDAIAIAAGGSGWLCVPSYVVIRMLRSSAHRCTC